MKFARHAFFVALAVASLGIGADSSRAEVSFAPVIKNGVLESCGIFIIEREPEHFGVRVENNVLMSLFPAGDSHYISLDGHRMVLASGTPNPMIFTEIGNVYIYDAKFTNNAEDVIRSDKTELGAISYYPWKSVVPNFMSTHKDGYFTLGFSGPNLKQDIYYTVTLSQADRESVEEWSRCAVNMLGLWGTVNESANQPAE